MDVLKLYVVGEETANPQDWNIWHEPKLVIANNEQEAIKLADSYEGNSVTEIPFNKPMFLMGKNEPNWGKDL